MNLEYSHLEFSSLDYKFNINFRVNEVNYVDSHGDIITITAGDGISITNTDDSMIFTTVDTTIPSYAVTYHPVENNILDLLSQELDVEVDKETMLELLKLVKKKDEDRQS